MKYRARRFQAYWLPVHAILHTEEMSDREEKRWRACERLREPPGMLVDGDEVVVAKETYETETEVGVETWQLFKVRVP